MKALGMIETKGLVGAIEVADVALKTADVTLINRHFVKAGIVSIEITGDVAAVKASVDAGVDAAKKLGVFLSCNVIARPDSSIENILDKIKVEKEELKQEETIINIENKEIEEKKEINKKTKK